MCRTCAFIICVHYSKEEGEEVDKRKERKEKRKGVGGRKERKERLRGGGVGGR